jgi:cation transport ATPase
MASFGMLGAAGAMIAAVLHNVSTLFVLGNAGRLLRFNEQHQNPNAKMFEMPYAA